MPARVNDAGAHADENYNVVEIDRPAGAWADEGGGLAVTAENFAEATVGSHDVPDDERVIVFREEDGAGWHYYFRRVRDYIWVPLTDWVKLTTGTGAYGQQYDAGDSLVSEIRYLYRFPAGPVDGADVLGVMASLTSHNGVLDWTLADSPPTGADTRVDLYGITADFNTGTVTWATQPTVDANYVTISSSSWGCSWLRDDSAGVIEQSGLTGLTRLEDRAAGVLAAGVDFYGLEIRHVAPTPLGYERYITDSGFGSGNVSVLF